MSITTANRSASGIGRTLIVGVAAGAAAAVVDLMVFFIGGAAGIVFEAQAGPGAPTMPVTAVAIIMASLVPALIGAAIFAALVRFSPRGKTIFIWVAVVIGLLSLLSPLTMTVALATRLTLAAMHLITAAIITWGLVRYT